MIAERYFNGSSRLRFVSVVLAALALTLGFGALSTVDAQNADTWKLTTGSMSVARRHAAVTPLLDGRVLIVGGNNPAAPTTTQPLASAEIYDPATDTFAPTGSMAVGRTLHTATLLPDGRVLVAGGWNPVADASIASAEIYNPATGTFTPTGSMNAARSQHTATLLQSGKVLIAAGWITGSSASAELYDPGTGAFTATTGSVGVRNTHTATLLQNGNVLVAGGFGTLGALATAELYNPAAGTFATTTGSMLNGRGSHAATRTASGDVLIVGGEPAAASQETYSAASGTFGSAATIGTGPTLNWPTTTLLEFGFVLIAGGNEGANANWSGTFAPTPNAYLAFTGGSFGTGSMNAGGQWGAVGANLTPEYHVVTGVRRLGMDQAAALRSAGIELTEGRVNKERWNAFWDAPLVLPDGRELKDEAAWRRSQQGWWKSHARLLPKTALSMAGRQMLINGGQ